MKRNKLSVRMESWEDRDRFPEPTLLVLSLNADTRNHVIRMQIVITLSWFGETSTPRAFIRPHLVINIIVTVLCSFNCQQGPYFFFSIFS